MKELGEIVPVTWMYEEKDVMKTILLGREDTAEGMRGKETSMRLSPSLLV